MAEQGLGPNGAQVAAADMAAMNAKELADVLETFETNYVLIDTPGQIELFTFRASGPVLIDAFGREDAALVYLNDPALVRNPGGFISSVLLNATVQFRHSLPFINVLSKADLLPEAELERIVKWSVDPFALYEALFEEAATAKTLLDVEFLKSLETIGVYRRVHPVSSEITFGFEEIYSQVQQAFKMPPPVSGSMRRAASPASMTPGATVRSSGSDTLTAPATSSTISPRARLGVFSIKASRYFFASARSRIFERFTPMPTFATSASFQNTHAYPPGAQLPR